MLVDFHPGTVQMACITNTSEKISSLFLFSIYRLEVALLLVVTDMVILLICQPAKSFSQISHSMLRLLLILVCDHLQY